MLSGRSDMRRIYNAIVEEDYEDPLRRGTGYVLISYGSPTLNNMPHMQLLRMIVSRSTRISSRTGRRMNLGNLKKGMRINAIVSSVQTRSNPPQSAAREITVLAEAPPMSVTTDRIAEVSVRENYILTGNPRIMDDQIRFNVSSATDIRDQTGRRIRISDLNPDQMVRIEHDDFMTMSIPPQTAAHSIRVIR